MARTVMVAPPNGLLFISDASGGAASEFLPSTPILSSDTVISVECLPEMDGETRVTLGPAAEVALVRPPAFDGMIKTPTKGVLVSTYEHEEILAAVVPSARTRIRIWTNGAMDPDEVAIGWGD